MEHPNAGLGSHWPQRSTRSTVECHHNQIKLMKFMDRCLMLMTLSPYDINSSNIIFLLFQKQNIFRCRGDAETMANIQVKFLLFCVYVLFQQTTRGKSSTQYLYRCLSGQNLNTMLKIWKNVKFTLWLKSSKQDQNSSMVFNSQWVGLASHWMCCI